MQWYIIYIFHNIYNIAIFASVQIQYFKTAPHSQWQALYTDLSTSATYLYKRVQLGCYLPKINKTGNVRIT